MISRLRAVFSRQELWFYLIFIGANLPMIVDTLRHNVINDFPDWTIWSELPARLVDGSLYDGRFRWSPVAAYIWVLLLPLGHATLVVAHFLALPFIGLRLALIAVAFWGFWADVVAGNIFIFAIVLAIMAWKGSRIGELGFVVLTVLAPRPIQIPLLIWLLWQRPHLRLPFVAIFALHALAVVLTGFGDEWIAKLAQTSVEETMLPFPINTAPSVLIGQIWLAIGIPVGVVLFWRGHVGAAGMAISPYWLPYYWLFLLLELVPRQERAG